MLLCCVILLLWINAIIFIFCECGERITIGFVEVNDEICQLKWYLFPYEIQRMMPNMMMATQEAVILKGCGNCSSCTREAFTNVSLTTI